MSRPQKPHKSTSRARLWLFRLAAIILGPLLLLFVIEAVLRLAGFGHPTGFFLPLKIDGKDCLVENDRFGWRFFGPERARNPFPFAISKNKGPETIRVFVFGESAAYGDPQPEFGLARLLQACLEGRFPDKHFEVVNAAMTAINSHVIWPIAKDCARAQGDFHVIYMGNNEVVGPFGSGTVFGKQAANLTTIRLGLALKTTRLGQLLQSIAHRAEPRQENQNEWGGMTMFLRNHVRADDPRMATVYDSFGRNLDDIIDTSRAAGARVVACTIVRNLKDCAPFASDHRAGMSEQDLAKWQELNKAAKTAAETGSVAEAADDLRHALQMDDSFAETHFRLGRCLLALGKATEALREFETACDDDTLRFRADSRVNEIIRRTVANRGADGVSLVDCEAAIAAKSPQGVVGNEFLYEHVHLNFEGNYWIARAIAEEIGRSLKSATPRPWPGVEDCAMRLGWDDSTKRAAEVEILSRLSEPPFREQSNNRENYERLRESVEQLQNAVTPASIRASFVRTKAAAEAAPDDWILQENLAQLDQRSGDAAGAVEALRRVARLIPHSADAWQTLGMSLDIAKRDDEAVAAFQEAARLRPEGVEAKNSLGEVFQRQGRLEDARREFEDVLRVKPYWSPAHFDLANVLEAMGKTNEAKPHFDAALSTRMNSAEWLNKMGKFAVSRGWFDAAVTNFTGSLRLYPSDPEVHVNLGLALIRLGKREEAREHFAEAVRLQPAFAVAHFCLGLEWGKSGDTEKATREFAEAVRLKPEMTEARLNLGIALSNQHRVQPALDQFEEVLRHDPKNKVALAYEKALRGANMESKNQ